MSPLRRPGGLRMCPILTGILSWVPGAYARFNHGPNPEALAAPAEYCYSVWLKHLVLRGAAGFSGIPRRVAELGHGHCGPAFRRHDFFLSLVPDLGCGRICRARFGALHAERNALALPEHDAHAFLGWLSQDAAVALCAWFPSANLSDAHLEKYCARARIEAIHEALQRSGEGFRYLLPWMDKVSLMAGWADHVFSHSVLPHVADPAVTCQAMAILGKPGAALTHQAQFGSHNIPDAWNGHWAVPDWMWRVAEGNKPFLIKRAPCSHQLANVDRVGLEVIMCLRDPATSAATRPQLAARFRDLSDGEYPTEQQFPFFFYRNVSGSVSPPTKRRS